MIKNHIKSLIPIVAQSSSGGTVATRVYYGINSPMYSITQFYWQEDKHLVDVRLFDLNTNQIVTNETIQGYYSNQKIKVIDSEVYLVSGSTSGYTLPMWTNQPVINLGTLNKKYIFIKNTASQYSITETTTATGQITNLFKTPSSMTEAELTETGHEIELPSGYHIVGFSKNVASGIVHYS